MATYTGTADANGDFNISFGTEYTSGEKITVTAEKDDAEKSIEIFAPSSVVGGGIIQMTGSYDNFPSNITEVKLTGITGSLNLKLTIVGPNTLTIDEGITILPMQCLNGWSNVRTLNLPSSLLRIESSSLSGVNPINLIIPDNCTFVGNSGFSGLNLTQSVILGSGLQQLEANALHGMTNCNQITCKAVTPPNISPTSFANLKTTCIFKVPAASVAAYQAAPNWSAFAARIQAI